MYSTHLVLPPDLGTFDPNSLSEFDYYVFVVVSSARDYEMAVKKIGPVLAACGSLCFLVDREHLQNIEGSAILGALFGTATESVPKQAVSYVAAISRSDLLSAEPRGTWLELFLSLENTDEDRERKLRSTVQRALSDKPQDYSSFGPIVGKVATWLVAFILRLHS